MAIKFIPLQIVPLLHSDLVNRFGGSPAIRDRNSLEHALSQPKAKFDGKYVHQTIFAKAAAYGFHIARNLPYVDGNRRLALVLMDVFLQLNGRNLAAPEQDAYAIMMTLAAGRLSKSELAAWLKSNCTHIK
jgi:death-on-curing protein